MAIAKEAGTIKLSELVDKDKLKVTMIACDGGCNKSHEEKDIKEEDTGFFCTPCHEKHFAVCDDCHKVKDSRTYTQVGDRHVCQRCISSFYYTCDSCSDYFNQDDLQREEDTDDDNTLCPSCYEAREDDGRIHEHSYQPQLEFSKMPWENTQYLGVELEVNTRQNSLTHCKKFKRFLKTNGYAKYFYFKHDGSLSTGYEIVTHPFTLQASHKKLNWKKILGWLQDNSTSSYQSGECGLHVHVSKEGMSKMDVGKLKLFMWTQQKKILQLSKRKPDGLSFCKFEPWDRNSILRYVHGAYSQEGRYWALNSSTGHGTVEFRIFRGCIVYDRFMASLQFAQAACEFVKVHGVRAIEGKDCWSHFTAWLRSKGTFQILEKYLIKNNIV